MLPQNAYTFLSWLLKCITTFFRLRLCLSASDLGTAVGHNCGSRGTCYSQLQGGHGDDDVNVDGVGDDGDDDGGGVAGDDGGGVGDGHFHDGNDGVVLRCQVSRPHEWSGGESPSMEETSQPWCEKDSFDCN